MLSDSKVKELAKRDKSVLGKVTKGGVSFGTLRDKTGLEDNLLRGSLGRLRQARQIKTAGSGRSLTYSKK